MPMKRWGDKEKHEASKEDQPKYVLTIQEPVQAPYEKLCERIPCKTVSDTLWSRETALPVLMCPGACTHSLRPQILPFWDRQGQSPQPT